MPSSALLEKEWQSLIKFGLYTGQRLGDLACLTWAQIDLDRDEIRLTTRKTDKSLLIPIALPLREHLLTLSTGDNPKAPVHPSAFEILHAQKGRVGTLSTSSASCSSMPDYASLAITRAGELAAAESGQDWT